MDEFISRLLLRLGIGIVVIISTVIYIRATGFRYHDGSKSFACLRCGRKDEKPVSNICGCGGELVRISELRWEDGDA
jgi:hypothetical protein